SAGSNGVTGLGSVAQGVVGGVRPPTSGGDRKGEFKRTDWEEETFDRHRDPYQHKGPEFGSSWAANKLLSHGGVEPALIAKLVAHLHGGRQMERGELRQLQMQATTQDWQGNPTGVSATDKMNINE